MLQRFRFVSINRKDGIELCKLEYVPGCVRRRKQSHRAVYAANRLPRRDDLGDTPAAEVRNTYQIQQEVLSAFGQKSLHRMSQRIFANIELARNVQYYHVRNDLRFNSHRHEILLLPVLLQSQRIRSESFGKVK